LGYDAGKLWIVFCLLHRADLDCLSGTIQCRYGLYFSFYAVEYDYGAVEF